MNDEQIIKIDKKIKELEEKKENATFRGIIDFIDGYIVALEWAKREL